MMQLALWSGWSATKSWTFVFDLPYSASLHTDYREGYKATRSLCYVKRTLWFCMLLSFYEFNGTGSVKGTLKIPAHFTFIFLMWQKDDARTSLLILMDTPSYIPPPSRYWADLGTADFAALQASGCASKTIAILPVAATEQHGPHLPVSVDTVLVNGVLTAALACLPQYVPALVLPTQSIGLSVEHARFAGTLTLKNETILRLWTDICECIATVGIRKLVLFNAHGGNVSAMDMVARDLRARLNMRVYSVSWFNLPLTDTDGSDVTKWFGQTEMRFGIHAGDVETSMMLALDPVHVHMDQAQNFASTAQAYSLKFDILGNGKSAKLGWQIQDYNPTGAVGNAAAATADKGRITIAAAGRALAQLLTELDLLPSATL